MSMQYNEPQRRSGLGWKIAVAILTLAVLALLTVVLVGQRGQNSPNATETPSSPAPAASSASTPTSAKSSPSTPAAPTATGTASGGWSDTGCNGTKGSPGSPVAALASTTWTPFLTAAIPSSPDLGPAKITGGLRECFQHSPAGAVMAAANIALGQLSPNGHRVVDQQWTPGPGKDKAAQDLANASGSTGGIAAYHLNGCDARACNVELVSAGSGLYAQGVVPLIWVNGDWKVDGSHLTPEPHLIQGIPAGFTAWGARS